MMRSGLAHMVHLIAGCMLVLLAAVTVSAQPIVTQTIALQEGWNAVFLEVTPLNDDPAAVFAGVPVESVWTFAERNSTMEFIKDPSEGLWGQPGWRVFLPAGEKPYLTNLFAITANRAYLIKATGPASWTVSGSPSTRAYRWVPDSFNLTGFHLDSSSAQNFSTFFAPSSAHNGQAYYRLTSAGLWEFVNNPSAVDLKQGEAYWIYCNGGSRYHGPLAIEIEGTRALDFGDSLNRLTVKVKNLATVSRTVTIERLPSSAPVPLEISSYDNTTGLVNYRPLSPSTTMTLDAGESRAVKLFVRRAVMTATTCESVLQISDGTGMRLFVPVSAQQ